MQADKLTDQICQWNMGKRDVSDAHLRDMDTKYKTPGVPRKFLEVLQTLVQIAFCLL